MGFEKLGLSAAAVKGAQAMGYTAPTPIQAGAIPAILAGRDVIGSAQTGTGKTAAFALPLISQLGASQPGTRVLVLEPTRELAAQVETSFRDLGRFTNLRTAVVFGGVGYGNQTQALKSGVDILIATPGRLLDHLNRGHCKLQGVTHLVLDEADRMLDMGFLPDVKRIVGKVPASRHTSLFSATIPPDIDALIRWAMRAPEIIELGPRRATASTVAQAVFPVSDGQKVDLLRELMKRTQFESVIVFCRTRHRADRIARYLQKEGHRVTALHSNKTQRQREQALAGFRGNQFNVLVATDIAARGLDVPEVSHVINFDVPHHPEDYVHRIGRTGRAEARGDAFTLMLPDDTGHVRDIERFIGRPLERRQLADYQYQPMKKAEEPAAKQTRPPRVTLTESGRAARPPRRHKHSGGAQGHRGRSKWIKRSRPGS